MQNNRALENKIEFLDYMISIFEKEAEKQKKEAKIKEQTEQTTENPPQLLNE